MYRIGRHAGNIGLFGFVSYPNLAVKRILDKGVARNAETMRGHSDEIEFRKVEHHRGRVPIDRRIEGGTEDERGSVLDSSRQGEHGFKAVEGGGDPESG